jgi:hypothetical protein
MKSVVPETFRPLLWSYDFDRIDQVKHKKTIIVQTINYGTLAQWRWLADTYGRSSVRDVLGTIPATEIRSRARRLASLMFDIDHFNYAPRGTY